MLVCKFDMNENGARRFLGLCFLGALLYVILSVSLSLDTLSVNIHGFQFTVHNTPVQKYGAAFNLSSDFTATRKTIHITNDEQGNTTRDRVNNVAFLKVPKAGSTTMQNLFFRFGIRHNLYILVPTKGLFLTMRKIKPLQTPKRYNIFACHTTYSKTFFNQLIPESVQIGIVREPTDRMISGAYYYRDVWQADYLMKIPQENLIHNLINHPEIYDKGAFSLTHNLMGKYYGLSAAVKSTDKEKINSQLDRLNSEFDLVLVLEKFDESLVMMKKYLSWSFLDIIYLKTNSHAYEHVVLNMTEQATVRERNFLDFAIYEYFTKIFDEKLKLMSHDFPDEVKYFRYLLKEVQTFCSQANIQDDSKLFVDKSSWDEEFTVLGKECRWMTTIEKEFINMIRNGTRSIKER